MPKLLISSWIGNLTLLFFELSYHKLLPVMVFSIDGQSFRAISISSFYHHSTVDDNIRKSYLEVMAISDDYKFSAPPPLFNFIGPYQYQFEPKTRVILAPMNKCIQKLIIVGSLEKNSTQPFCQSSSSKKQVIQTRKKLGFDFNSQTKSISFNTKDYSQQLTTNGIDSAPFINFKTKTGDIEVYASKKSQTTVGGSW